jgi:hypothetical protein
MSRFHGLLLRIQGLILLFLAFYSLFMAARFFWLAFLPPPGPGMKALYLIGGLTFTTIGSSILLRGRGRRAS